jgi:hypothetical protein
MYFLMVAVIMPLFSMEKERVIYIMGDVSIIPLKESNVVLMKALHKHSQLHQGIINQRGLIPRYSYVSQDALYLVNEALTVRPDQFKDYYNRLSVHDRVSLIKLSGQYDDEGKKVMLDVPEVTKRLIEVYFTDNGLRNHIKSYLKNEDEDYVRNYFKEQLIYSKRLLKLKQSLYPFDKPILDMLREDIYLGSVFLNGIHTIRLYDHPISLRTGDKVRQTYATSFGIDNYEYRITDVRDNQCLLWVINHDNPDAIFSTLIKHKGNIKGCCLSNTKTDVEGALTFSDHDMVFSIITTVNGVSFIESVAVESPHQIVDARFEPIKSNWHVASYEGLEAVFGHWNMEGKCIDTYATRPFKQYGLLEKIATCKTTSGYRTVEIFNVADLYSVGISDVATDDGVYWIQGRNRTPLQYLYTINGYYYSKLFQAGSSIAMYHLAYPFFGEKEEADFWSQPESPIHKVYSPNGSFLMCNSLKKKWGMLYVETVIQDAITHKQILSIDTLYNGFVGVGFTHDETELIFLDHMGGNQKVSLLNDKDKQKLFQIEDVACTNLGVASTVKRLCMECREKGTVTLHEDDPNRKMLIDWSRKFPELLQLLTKCLPITKIKK